MATRPVRGRHGADLLRGCPRTSVVKGTRFSTDTSRGVRRCLTQSFAGTFFLAALGASGGTAYDKKPAGCDPAGNRGPTVRKDLGGRPPRVGHVFFPPDRPPDIRCTESLTRGRGSVTVAWGQADAKSLVKARRYALTAGPLLPTFHTVPARPRHPIGGPGPFAFLDHTCRRRWR